MRGALNTRLLGCPHLDLFNAVGRQWLVQQPAFTETERLIVSSALTAHLAGNRADLILVDLRKSHLDPYTEVVLTIIAVAHSA